MITLAVDILRGAWRFIRQNWQAVALTGVILAAGYAGWRGRGEWDAGKIRKEQAARTKVEHDLAACTARVGEFATAEAGYLKAIKTLRDNDAEEEREIAESRKRAEAMDLAHRRALDELLVTQAARRDAQAREATAIYQATEAKRALDELMLRWIEADPAAPAGIAQDLRRRGFGERTISGGG